MVSSLLSLFKYLGENRVCSAREAGEYGHFEGSVRELREAVMRNSTQGSRAKAYRVLTDSNRGYEESDLFLDIGGGKKHHE